MASWRAVGADGGSRILARRQRGTLFDAPVSVDTGDEPVRDPRVDLNGRGQGLAGVGGRHDPHVHALRLSRLGMGDAQALLEAGQVTQAVFVFTNMLRKLLNDEKPDYVAAVFDTAAPVNRRPYGTNTGRIPAASAAKTGSQ